MEDNYARIARYTKHACDILRDAERGDSEAARVMNEQLPDDYIDYHLNWVSGNKVRKSE